jgi:hypothetical protein
VIGMVTQLGLLAQTPDLENWTDLLILLVMGVLWLAGALAKAWNAKRSAQRNGQNDAAQQQSRRQETWQERLARKVEEIQRTAETRSAEMARRLEQKTGLPAGGGQIRPAHAPGGKLTVRQGPGGESILVYERPEPRPAVPSEPPPARPRPIPPVVPVAVRAPVNEPTPVPRKSEGEGPAKPILAGLSSVTPSASEPSEPDTAQTKRPDQPADLELPPLIDYCDPDALRKAILQYEILGKPLAFRDLFE